ncbi:MAG: complex I subunit 1 family protein [Candidatus Omnitrophota bacterium]
MMILKYLFYYFIFPGFLFASIAGMMAGWVDRKVTARIQYRVGPPWYQNFADIVKLFGKEIITPAGKNIVFLVSPFLGLIAVSLVASLLGDALFNKELEFTGDLIVVMYLLTIPAISLIIGASSSSNPLASVGASREMKMVLAYELPFILAIAIVIIKTSSLRISDIISYQASFGSLSRNLSGIIGLLVMAICIQAKLGFVPFDAAEAEQEIMSGTLIEYSGLPLAIFRLTRFILLYTLPIFLIILFLTGSLSLFWLIIKYVLILVLIILIKNTNPRLRIDQAIGFFWRILTPLAILGVVLAFLGK